MSIRCPRHVGAGLRLAACAVLFSSTTAAQAQNEVQGTTRTLQLSLEDALRIALRNNFDLEIERLATDVARHDAVGSWGAFDPLFRLAGSAAKSETEPVSQVVGAEESDLQVDSSLNVPLISGGSLDLAYSRVNSETDSRFATFDLSTSDVLTVTLTQPLLRGAWRRYATVDQRASQIALERQIEREREVRARLLLDVSNAYWSVVSAQEELAVRVLAVERGLQQLAQDQRRLEVGAGTEVDVLQSETNVAQQEQLRLQAEYTLREARDTLRRILAPKPGEDYEAYLEAWDWPIETLTSLPTETSAAPLWRDSLRSGLERRPELAQLRLDVEAAEVDLQRAHSTRLPQLDLTLSSSSRGLDPDPSEALDKATSWDFPSSSAGFTFSLPLWNRTARNAEAAARSSLRRARLLYDRLELDLLAEVRLACNEVDRQREAVGAAVKSRTLAQRQLEAEETRQEVGLSTTFQVLQFQEDLARALSTEVSARAAYAKALARREFVAGTLEGPAEPGGEPPPE
jgi:HAE1 family hydrophobic/amphiphilic exporter-1